MQKKDIPYELLVVVEEILKTHKETVTVKAENNCYYCVIDKDQQSGFYFKIFIDFKIKNVSKPDKPTMLLCEYYPANLSTNSVNLTFLLPIHIKSIMTDWIGKIEKYNQVDSVYDDPILKGYENYYTEKFKIVDEDANTAPFTPEQQEYLEKYLNYIRKRMLAYPSKDEAEKEIVSEIIEEVISTDSKLQELTKNQSVGKIAKIIAKVYKLNKKYGREIAKKLGDEVIKAVVKAAVDYATNHIHLPYPHS